MHFQSAESSGPQAPLTNDASRTQGTRISYTSTTLPFGKPISLSSVNGPTYLTAQTIVQQVAYALSDKIFTYSPDSFDLDLALKQWKAEQESNVHGFTTGVNAMQTRSGAGSIALGYMSSPRFDIKKRHLPQTLVTSSASLKHLQPVLDQLSLQYPVTNPIVVHVSASDYTAKDNPALVTDYIVPQTLSEDLGLAMLSSHSAYESQHMSLLATLLAKEVPTLHVYDGVQVGRETTRVVDIMGKDRLGRAYHNIMDQVSKKQQTHVDVAGRTLNLLTAFNEELGTDYNPFEYYGDNNAETLVVSFGSVETSLAAQMAYALAKNGAKVGAITVRVYRPFIEHMFLGSLPNSVRRIVVLGQVEDDTAVKDESVSSRLYSDVLAAVTLSPRFAHHRPPIIKDEKYACSVVWTPSKMASVLQQISDDDILGPTVKQYSFWDVDESSGSKAASSIAQLLSKDGTGNVALRSQHNNLAQGGSVRSDIRCSPKSIEAPYSVKAATFTYVGSEDLLKSFDVLASTQYGASMLVRLPGSEGQDLEKLEKRLPAEFRLGLVKKRIQFHILDPDASAKLADDPTLESVLIQLAFLRLIGQSGANVGKPESSDADVPTLASELDKALKRIDIPETWTQIESNDTGAKPSDLRVDSFTSFKHEELPQQPTTVSTWQTAARALAFKEATGATATTRPDLPIKTHTVRVKSRKRLTPTTYDRNIFHIEFDLTGTSLTYSIGEALGIHSQNDPADVGAFIKWYNLDPNAIVSVPARTDPTGNMHENRTITQALTQNLDIFGRPPKRFYAELADFASNPSERDALRALGGPEGANEFKRRAETDTITFADILLEFPSAHPPFADVVRLVEPLKRREYSIASSQRVQPDSVALLIVTVGWVDPKGRDRFGQATRYLNDLSVGDPVTVSVKPSVMKLPASTTAPLVMAGLGTGLAPFRAFVQERAWQRSQGHAIGEVLLYMGSRHQREEYLYGEEWEAYRDAGVITLMGCAFSRDQAQKIYIQDKMRSSMTDIRGAYLKREGSFYLCGPTWPVPDVQGVLEEAVEVEAREALVGGEGKTVKKGTGRRRIEELKDEGRYVLEVY